MEAIFFPKRFSGSFGTRKMLKKENREKKKRFKLNKLILYVYPNSFYLFISIIQGLRSLKICIISKNFDYI